jgi:hypothetical protein
VSPRRRERERESWSTYRMQLMQSYSSAGRRESFRTSPHVPARRRGPERTECSCRRVSLRCRPCRRKRKRTRTSTDASFLVCSVLALCTPQLDRPTRLSRSPPTTTHTEKKEANKQRAEQKKRNDEKLRKMLKKLAHLLCEICSDIFPTISHLVYKQWRRRESRNSIADLRPHTTNPPPHSVHHGLFDEHNRWDDRLQGGEGRDARDC